MCERATLGQYSKTIKIVKLHQQGEVAEPARDGDAVVLPSPGQQEGLVHLPVHDEATLLSGDIHLQRWQ